MFYKIIAREQDRLELKILNAKTLKVLQETDKGEGIIKSKNIDHLFKKLEI